jgi:hypothetical protein
MKKTLLTLAVMMASYSTYGQNTYPWAASGSVGIGTISPESGFQLDVNGLGTVGTQGSARIYLGTTDASHAFIQARDNSINQNLNFYASSYSFNTGNVGIGTTSPNSKLEITSGASDPFYFNGTYNKMKSALGFTYIESFHSTSFVIDATNSYSDRFFNVSKGASYIDGGSPVELFRIQENGNVGIGTTSPGAKLQVAGVIQGGVDGNTQGQLTVWSNTAGAEGNIYGMSGGGMLINTHGNSYPIELDGSMVVLGMTGNIGIGTTDSKGHKLAVNGDIIATSVIVKLYADWPDYVFKPAYQLPSLAEVKTYIENNHHLPDMPSAEDISKSGLNLGEANKVLTKKVEELTLYLIEKEEQIKEIKEAQQSQREKDQNLQEQLKAIQDQLNNMSGHKTNKIVE